MAVLVVPLSVTAFAGLATPSDEKAVLAVCDVRYTEGVAPCFSDHGVGEAGIGLANGEATQLP
jgi:hypothetical protein